MFHPTLYPRIYEDTRFGFRSIISEAYARIKKAVPAQAGPTAAECLASSIFRYVIIIIIIITIITIKLLAVYSIFLESRHAPGRAFEVAACK